MRQLLHISINFAGDFDAQALTRELNKSLDWIHYMPNCWIVLTTSDSDVWQTRLQPLLGDQDFMLITPIDAEMTRGWVARWIIDWFNQARDKLNQIDPLLLPAADSKKRLPPKS